MRVLFPHAAIDHLHAEYKVHKTLAESSAADLGLQHAVTFAGYRYDLPALMAGAVDGVTGLLSYLSQTDSLAANMVCLLTNRPMALFSPEAVASQWTSILSGFARQAPERLGLPSMNTHSG